MSLYLFCIYCALHEAGVDVHKSFRILNKNVTCTIFRKARRRGRRCLKEVCSRRSRRSRHAIYEIKGLPMLPVLAADALAAPSSSEWVRACLEIVHEVRLASLSSVGEDAHRRRLPVDTRVVRRRRRRDGRFPSSRTCCILPRHSSAPCSPIFDVFAPRPSPSTCFVRISNASPSTSDVRGVCTRAG